MASHPLNLMLRFILEMIAVISTGIWGWGLQEGSMKYVLAFGFPIIIAGVWGVFAVPGDPSRSGNAPVPVRGSLRLIIELGVFGLACWLLYDLGYIGLAKVFLLLVLIHHLTSYDRIKWLLKQ